MEMLTGDLLRNPDLLSDPAAADEAQRLGIDAVRFGCLTR